MAITVSAYYTLAQSLPMLSVLLATTAATTARFTVPKIADGYARTRRPEAAPPPQRLGLSPLGCVVPAIPGSSQEGSQLLLPPRRPRLPRCSSDGDDGRPLKTDDNDQTGGNRFFQLMCCRIGGAHYLPGDDVKLAKFDIVLTANDFWKDLAHGGANSTWEAVRRINPRTQFFAYRDSMVCDNEDRNTLPDVNNVARWNVSRGLKQGSLNVDNPQLFLKDSKGNRIYVASYNHTFLMDFGSAGWRQYFIDATVADNFGRPWSTAGQYIDNVLSTILTSTKANPVHHSNGFSCFEPGCPVKYGGAQAWSAAMNGFANAAADAFAKRGVPTLANRGLTAHPAGVAAWVALDRSVAAGHAPVGQLEEGAFVTPWYSPPACVDFLPLSSWQSQIRAMGLMKHSKVMMLSHSKLAREKTPWANSSGIDNWHKPVQFWDILWYCLASFSIGKNDIDKTGYFAFSEAYPMKSPYQNINYYPEYELLDLGKATASFTNRTVGGASVYMREFEKGWVLVNPTDGYTNASDARNVTLPGPGRVRTHENLHKAAETLPVVHTIEVLSAHRGLFVLKAAVPRLKPARMAPEKVSQQQQPQQQQAGEPENFWKKIFKVGRPSRFESTSVKTDDETPSSATTGQPPKSWPSHYDVIWTERGDWSSAHALGSMPLGSGITGCNVWVDDTGIRLLFGSTDSYDEHNLLMKLGQVGIELKPNPFSTLPPPPPPPSPPYHGNRSAMSSYTRRGGVIGCASEDGCVDPHDSAQMRIHNCTSAATCHIEAAAACGAWSMCTSFSISHNWHSGAAAQMFSCARRFASDGAWSSWQLKNSTCQPLPPKRYPTFKQRLDLNRGLVTLKSGPLQLEIWVDWIHDVTRIRLNTTDGSAFGARVVSQNWRNVTRPIVGDELQPMGLCLGEFGIAENITRQKDTTVESSGELLWYRRNPERTVVTATMEQQLLPLSALHNPVTGKQLDILSNNTFGLLVQSSASSPVELHSVGTGGTVLETSETTGMLELQISAHVAQTPSAQTWMAQLRAKAAKAAAVSYETALQAHAAHWAAIWQRSWFDTLAEPGTDSYNQSFGFALGRYVNLCQGRGKTPTHFTGGIFYQAAKGESGIDPQYNRYDYDWRSWGAPYWWQNTRFAYDPMISDGDFDHLAPLFDMYTDQMTVSEALVKRYYKHSGAKFYETGEPWGATVMDQWGCAKSPGAQCGCFGNCTVGRNPKICRPSDLYTRGVCTKLNVTNSDCDEQNPYIRHHWSSALELPLMMLRYFLVSGNVTAAQKWLVPVATQTMTFFKEHWQNASFFLQDAQALESYSHCDQPSCQLAGMRQLLRGLLLSQVKSLFAPSLQALFASMHALVLAIKLPVFTSLNTPRHSEKFHNQSQLPLLAPCAMGGVATKGYQPPKWTQQNNEPIAMYAVWPYELFGVNRSGMQSLIPASLGLDTDEKVLEFARASYNLQPYPGRPEGYNMISVFSANLGLANTTKDFLHYKWSEAVKAGPFDYTSSRFPVWWGPSNRGGEVCDDPSCNEIADEARIALQHMLLQSDNHGERLLLFPAWPTESWPDLSFRIHAERSTILEGELRGGKLISLIVTPPDRQKDVVVLLQQRPLKSDDDTARYTGSF